MHVVEGLYSVDGTWTFEPDADGTRVHFVAEGELTGMMKLFAPLATRLLARQFARYHRNPQTNLEGS